ncbi:unnamed protein product [Allacma fusca]|uniref:Uncharacterized protein n=1 Tax=Allacma fusca TaxID=39272 RepID=A0A8J2PXQ7_9HEXA|nr:unnamed protein product [Allacma fusca]
MGQDLGLIRRLSGGYCSRQEYQLDWEFDPRSFTFAGKPSESLIQSNRLNGLKRSKLRIYLHYWELRIPCVTSYLRDWRVNKNVTLPYLESSSFNIRFKKERDCFRNYLVAIVNARDITSIRDLIQDRLPLLESRNENKRRQVRIEEETTAYLLALPAVLLLQSPYSFDGFRVHLLVAFTRRSHISFSL